MTEAELPRWLEWAREIQSLAQTGLAHSENDFDARRYRRLAEIAAEIVSTQSGLGQEATDRLLADFVAQPGYATPKIDVRGAVVQDGQILLVQERADERWCMPGGWADVGECPSEAVVREVREESGFDVAPRKLLGVYDANRGGRPLSFYHAYKIVILCEVTGGEARPSDETLHVAFYPFGKLPPLSSNRTNARHLAEVQAHLEDPARLATFD